MDDVIPGIDGQRHIDHMLPEPRGNSGCLHLER